MRLAITTSSVLLGLVLAFAPGVAQAALISGVELNTYSTNLDSSGRYARNTITGAPDSFIVTDNFLTNGTTSGSISWSLNGRYTLNTIDVYNYRETTIPQNRGAKDVNVFYSNDYGQTYTLFGGTFQTVAASPLTSTNTPTTINLVAVTATNVKFDILNNHGDSGFVGLNEVAFNGTPLPPTVQVPLTVTGFSSQFSGRPAASAVDGFFDTTNVAQMWLSSGSDSLPTITFSLGATPLVLDHLNVWNYNETGSTNPARGLNDIQIELFDASMVSLGLAMDAADGNTTFSLNEAKGQRTATMDTLGIQNAPAASFFKIITTANPNTGGFGGLTEVQAFSIVPEPSSMALLAFGMVFMWFVRGWRNIVSDVLH